MPPLPTLLAWLRRNAGWFAFAALVTWLASREIRSRVPTVDAAPITAEEPRPALASGKVYPTVRVNGEGYQCRARELWETGPVLYVTWVCRYDEGVLDEMSP